MKVLVKNAWGSDDPTKAAFPFLHANALAEAGHVVCYQPKEFWLLTLYAKAKQENVPAHILRQLKEAFERA